MKIKFILLFFLYSSLISNQDSFFANDLQKERLKGKVKSIIESGGDKKTLYNEEGYKTKVNTYNNETTFNYKQGRLYEESMVTKNGNCFIKRYEWDIQNRIKKVTSIYPDGKIDSKDIYEYNNQYQLIKKTHIPESGNDYCYTYEYTDEYEKEIHCSYGLVYLNEKKNGLVSRRKKYDSNGSIQAKYEYEYNSNGDVILEIQYSENKEVDRITTSYEYDQVGNWISKISIHSVANTRFGQRRTIEYY